MALCQFLPGPTSSQVGVSLGLIRAGYWGGLAAWIGFTLPSAILLTAFAFGVGALGGPIGSGVLHGLKLVAVAIVAQAVWGMARTLCPDRTRASIAGIAAVILLFHTASAVQIGAIALGGIAGLWLCRATAVSYTHLDVYKRQRPLGARRIARHSRRRHVPLRSAILTRPNSHGARS